MTRKQILIGFLLAGLSSFLSAAGGRKNFSVYDFSKGLDTYHSPATLPDGFVQDSLNVLFDDVSPITKRMGYTVAWSTKQYSFTGLWTYTDPALTTWQIARSSDQITASDLNGTVVKISTVSSSNIVGAVNAFGYIYFVDATQGVYYWNGTSTTYVASSPKGTIIASFHNRLWVTGAAVPNGNQLYGSKYYDGSVWTTGLNATDPVQFSVGLQDNFDNTTAAYVYLDTLYIFKHYAIYALYGFDQTNFQISFLTQECGCIDGGSIQTYEGSLKFVSLRGVEKFDGYRCDRISDPIKDKVERAIQSGLFTKKSWEQTSAADFGGGSGYATYTDTTTTAGLVQLGADTKDFNSVPSGWTADAGTWSSIGGDLVSPSVMSTITGSPFPLGPGFFMKGLLAIPNDGINRSNLCIGAVNSSGNGYWACLHAHGTPPEKYYISITTTPSNARNLPASDVYYNTGVDLANLAFKTVSLSRFATGYMDIAFGGSDGVVGAISTDTIKTNITGIDRVAIYSFPDAGPGKADFLHVRSSTGSYYSAVHNTLNFSSWGDYVATESADGGTVSYFMRASSSSFGVTDSAPAWTSQANNSLITASTGVYIQTRIDMAITNITQNPRVNDFKPSWYSGTQSIPMASTVWDNRYWLSLTTNTANTANDTVLVLNSRGAWSAFDIHAGAFTQTRNNLYHADSSATGNVYQDNNGHADNGSAINAYFKTKDLSFGGLSADSYLYSIYPSAMNTGSCAMTVAYDMDHSGTDLSLGSPLLNEFSTAASVKLPFPVDSSHQDFGKSINFTFGTKDASCAWKFYGLEGLYRQRPIQ